MYIEKRCQKKMFDKLTRQRRRCKEIMDANKFQLKKNSGALKVNRAKTS